MRKVLFLREQECLLCREVITSSSHPVIRKCDSHELNNGERIIETQYNHHRLNY